MPDYLHLIETHQQAIARKRARLYGQPYYAHSEEIVSTEEARAYWRERYEARRAA